MKFLIVAFFPKTMVPYAKPYEDTITENGGTYDILYWDRYDNSGLEQKENEYILHKLSPLGDKKYKKLYSLYTFRQTVKKLLKKNKYDKVIVLSTIPAILLSDILLKDYSGNYIFDIRDYTYEKYSFYSKRVQKLIDHSFFTAISSDGFKKFLGDRDKLVVNHNISNEDYVCKDVTLHPNNVHINIGFVGVVRYFEENQKLIKMVQGDNRFCLSYIGRMRPDCDLKEYCKEKGYGFVHFEDEFTNEDKPRIYEKIDIINAIYGTGSLEVTTAIPNRYYDALIFKKPLLASKGTYLGELAEKNHLGIAIDINDADNHKRIQAFCDAFNEDEFLQACDVELQRVLKEQQKYLGAIKKFIC